MLLNKTKNREHVVEVFDNSFSPSRVTIEEGDRVIFRWSREKVNFALSNLFKNSR